MKRTFISYILLTLSYYPDSIGDQLTNKKWTKSFDYYLKRNIDLEMFNNTHPERLYNVYEFVGCKFSEFCINCTYSCNLLHINLMKSYGSHHVP